jgi:hypothetical protein
MSALRLTAGLVPRSSLSSIRHARTGRGNRPVGRSPCRSAVPVFSRHRLENAACATYASKPCAYDSIKALSPRSCLLLLRTEPGLATGPEASSTLPAFFFDSIPNFSPARSAHRSPPHADFSARGGSTLRARYRFRIRNPRTDRPPSLPAWAVTPRADQSTRLTFTPRGLP